MKMKKTLLVLVLITAMTTANARTVSIRDNPFNNDSTYYHNGAEGWHWYHDPEKKLEEPEMPPPPPAQEPPAMPAPLSAEWVRTMLPRYMDRAWSDPSPENVEAYFLLQRFALDRSQKFAQVAQSVVLGNPYLDETNRRPLASFAIPTVDKEAGRKRGELITKVAERAGIFFFYKSNCAYCEAQAPILKYIENAGFEILAISTDGGQLTSTQFDNNRIDEGQSKSLGVTAAPSLFLVSETGGFTPLGQGMLSYEELVQRILVVANRQGWVTEEELNETRPIMDGNDKAHDMSIQMPKMLEAKNTQELQSNPVNPDGFIEPKVLLSLLNNNTRLTGKIEDETDSE